MTRLPLFILRRFSLFYLRYFENVTLWEVEGFENFAHSHDGFKRGDHGLVIPFRHIAKADAPLYSALFGQYLPSRNRTDRLYYWVRFLFGDMVLDWTGPAARWIFPGIGAVPVSNQKIVSSQLRTIRNILTDLAYPLCMAPEGQVNYYNDKAGDLTGGLTHFIKWSLEAGRDVVIQPVRIFYKYNENINYRKLIIGEFYAIGLDISIPDKSFGIFLDKAVETLLNHLFFYLTGSPCESGDVLAAIIEQLIGRSREKYPLDRRKRLIDKVFIFRNGVFQDLKNERITVPGISRKIKNLWRRPEDMNELHRLYQYQQLLDVLVNFDPGYHGNGSKNREIEQTLYLLDIVNRLQGGDINSRYFPKKTRATVLFETPLRFVPGENPDKWKELFLTGN
ncbi:MAG: hypothetical protein JXR86_12095 [Spirochaetales bacterium]|nr:hypothetical protein [Spirochaetales bacterium]